MRRVKDTSTPVAERNERSSVFVKTTDRWICPPEGSLSESEDAGGLESFQVSNQLNLTGLDFWAVEVEVFDFILWWTDLADVT